LPNGAPPGRAGRRRITIRLRTCRSLRRSPPRSAGASE
jgi:hypothetical protein